MLKRTVINTPHSEIEKGIFEFSDDPVIRMLIMALLNDFKFIKKVLQDELGEERTEELFKKVQNLKNSHPTEIPGEEHYKPKF